MSNANKHTYSAIQHRSLDRSRYNHNTTTSAAASSRGKLLLAGAMGAGALIGGPEVVSAARDAMQNVSHQIEAGTHAEHQIPITDQESGMTPIDVHVQGE